MPQFFTPESHDHWLRLRAEDVTSTESAALFGLSPWLTEFELFHAKAGGLVSAVASNEPMRWGSRLERAIATGLAEDLGLEIRSINRYARHSDVPRMGSSFDFQIIGAHPERASPDYMDKAKEVADRLEGGPGLLEIKNTAFAEGWSADEAPAHIEVQVCHQMEVMGYRWAVIGALVSGNRPLVIVREYDAEMAAGIKDAVTAFWARVEKGEAPEPDFQRDAAFIRALYSRGGGGTADLRGNEKASALCTAYKALAERATECEKGKSALQAELLTLIGDADVALLDGYKITSRTVKETEISYVRAAYRGFVVTSMKQKETTE